MRPSLELLSGRLPKQTLSLMGGALGLVLPGHLSLCAESSVS